MSRTYIYIHTNIHTCTNTSVHAYIRTYMHTHIHAYIHTYIHMHIHVHTYFLILITHVRTRTVMPIYTYIHIHAWKQRALLHPTKKEKMSPILLKEEENKESPHWALGQEEVYMYMCTCMYVYVCLCVYVCVCIYIYARFFVCIFVCRLLDENNLMNIYIYICSFSLYLHVSHWMKTTSWIHMYVCICMYVYVCMYMYIYMHMHIYIYIYIYIFFSYVFIHRLLDEENLMYELTRLCMLICMVENLMYDHRGCIRLHAW